MPILLSVVELVDHYTLQVVLFFTHTCDVNSFYSSISVQTSLLPLISCLEFILTKYSLLVFRTQLHLLYLQQTSRTSQDIQLDVYKRVENSSSLFFQISCSQGILNTSRMSYSLFSRSVIYMYLSQLMRTFTNYLKSIVVLTFHFLIFRMSEYRNPTIKHISTYTLVSSSITTYVTDLFLGSNPHSKIPF